MAFTEITGTAYTRLMLQRLHGEVPELTWLQQFRDLLRPHLHAGVTILDIGCGPGYAHNSFKEFGVGYTGVDFEPEYLEAGKRYFAHCPEVNFIQHDFIATPLPTTGQLVICSATLEHCPSLMPALGHLVDGAEKVLLLRTFLGPDEDIYSIPSPVQNLSQSHRKHTNQYAFKDVLGYIDSRGFKTRTYRDRYTDSIPQYVDGAIRTFFVVYGEKIDS
jgi:SAM-dependent methyltransferase